MAHLDTATAPLADRAAMGLAGMAGGMMSEAELVKTGLRWWLRSMAGGWMGQWMEQFTTEDFEILDYNSTIPTYVCGQEGACKLYNALLSCHSPRDVELDIDIGEPEMAGPHIVFTKVTVSFDWGPPYQYRLDTNMELTLRDGLMSRLLWWGADAPRPVGACGLTPLEELEGYWRAQLAPHRIVDPSTMPPTLLPAPEEEVAGMHEFLNILVTQWSSAITDPEWFQRWGNICFTEDFTLVDHTTAPRSLKVEGREAAKQYYLKQIQMDFAAGGGRSTRKWETKGWEVEPGPPASLVLKAQCTWKWEDEYQLPVRVEGRMQGMKCQALELRPLDLPVEAGGRRAEDAVVWSPGDVLDTNLWRQWASESTAVHINRPCEHNSWDNVRIRRGWVVLRCRICDAKWRQRPRCTERCYDFLSPEGCPRGENCKQLHVHHTKRTAEERARDSAAAPSAQAKPTPPGPEPQKKFRPSPAPA
eukprot:Hpha_TRINITY_DN11768_c0_g1::TRINITY_DN11768_c0_g1_i2::g.31670::m.31670